MSAEFELFELKQKIEALIQVNKFPEALKLVAGGLAACPDDAGLHGYGAQACLGLEDHEQAWQFASKCIEFDPQNEWGYRLMAIIMGVCDKYEEALSAAEKAVSLAPYLANTHVTLGNAQLALEKLKDADKTAETLREIAPEAELTFIFSGNVELAKQNPYKAKDYFLEALRLEPNSFNAVHNLGVAELNAFHTEEALGYFKRAVEMNPNHVNTRTNLKVAVNQHYSDIWENSKGYIVMAATLLFYVFLMAPGAVAKAALALPVLLLLGILFGIYGIKKWKKRKELHPKVLKAVAMAPKRLPAQNIQKTKAASVRRKETLDSALIVGFFTTAIILMPFLFVVVGCFMVGLNIYQIPLPLLIIVAAGLLLVISNGIYLNYRHHVIPRLWAAVLSEYKEQKGDPSDER